MLNPRYIYIYKLYRLFMKQALFVESWISKWEIESGKIILEYGISCTE